MIASKVIGAPFMHVFRQAHAARDWSRPVVPPAPDGEALLQYRRRPTRFLISEEILRAEVGRDLDTLMNTVALSSTVDLEDFPDIASSILNFGIADVARRTTQDGDLEQVGDELSEAIRRFEPRLDPATVTVERDEIVDNGIGRIRFRIRADLLCSPLPVPVEFVADLESESGAIIVRKA
jgi:type VI secretion system protein ImpF